MKVLILANAFQIQKDERRAIDQIAERGGTVIWNFAPDIIGPDGIDFSRIAAVTGFDLDAKTGNTPLTMTSPISDETWTVGGQTWSPRITVSPQEGSDIVAQCADDGAVSAAARPAGPGVSLYTAAPRLPVNLLREILHRAGVHLYHDRPGMTGVVGPYLIVHTAKSEEPPAPSVIARSESSSDAAIYSAVAGSPDPATSPTEGLQPSAEPTANEIHRFAWPAPITTVTRLAPFHPWPLHIDDDNTWLDALPERTTAVYYCE